MAVAYESRAVAVVDTAMRAYQNLHRVALAAPRTCNVCGRTARSLSNWQAQGRQRGRPMWCARISWLRLTHCRGHLVRAVTS